jgi:hypothetical protein
LLDAFSGAMSRLRSNHLFFAEHNAIVNDTSKRLGLDRDVFKSDGLNLHIYTPSEYSAIAKQLHRYATR